VRRETQTAGKAAEPEWDEMGHALGFEVRLPHLVARFRRQPREDGRLAHRLKTRQANSAAEDRRLPFKGAVDNHRLFRPGVRRLELERLRHRVTSPTNEHGDAPRRAGAAFLQSADLLACPLQRRERPVGPCRVGRRPGAGPRVVAVRGDIPIVGRCAQQPCAEHQTKQNPQLHGP
jgi:hypothetical protein